MVTVANSLQNRSREVKWTVLKVEGGVLPDFEVQEEKTDFREN